MPERIQLRRTKGWRKPEGAIVVARPSKWGNPFTVGSWVQTDAVDVPITPRVAVAMYRDLVERQCWEDEIRAELAGRDLGCWCPLEDASGNRVPCHADVLLELANPGWAP